MIGKQNFLFEAQKKTCQQLVDSEKNKLQISVGEGFPFHLRDVLLFEKRVCMYLNNY